MLVIEVNDGITSACGRKCLIVIEAINILIVRLDDFRENGLEACLQLEENLGGHQTIRASLVSDSYSLDA